MLTLTLAAVVALAEAGHPAGAPRIEVARPLVQVPRRGMTTAKQDLEGAEWMFNETKSPLSARPCQLI